MPPRSILVVDDDDIFSAALCDWIRKTLPAATIRTAGTAEEARRILDTEPCDLLVSDVVMETPDAGWQLGLDAKKRGIAVLLLSADARAPWLGGDVHDLALVQKTELSPSSFTDFITAVLASR